MLSSLHTFPKKGGGAVLRNFQRELSITIYFSSNLCLSDSYYRRLLHESLWNNETTLTAFPILSFPLDSVSPFLISKRLPVIIFVLSLVDPPLLIPLQTVGCFPLFTFASLPIPTHFFFTQACLNLPNMSLVALVTSKVAYLLEPPCLGESRQNL